MKISHKLVSSFIGISLLTGVVGAVGDRPKVKKITETLAIKEAEHVAQVIAISIAHHSSYDQKSIALEPSNDLQSYIMLLHKLQKRDIEVVNRQKLIVADAVPEDVGTVLEDDQGKEVEQTMQDGIPRTYLEKSADYPQGVNLIVIPLKVNQNKIDGAVILEYSSLYDEAIAQAMPTTIVIGITSLGGLVLALILGWRISSMIAGPLQSLTEMALHSHTNL